MRHLGIATAVMALALGACATTDPYTGEQQTSSATKGAIIGSVAGAVIGIATGDNARERRNRALIGAGIGGLSGAAVGHYMDRQEAELRRRLQGTGVSVTRSGDNLILNMPGNVTFGTDESSLRPQFFEVLDSVALVLNEYQKTLIEVAGHTDSTGPESYNQSLSERRASAVAQYLKSQGILNQRIITRGYGEQYPIADNSTAAGRAENRRVELTLAPVTN